MHIYSIYFAKAGYWWTLTISHVGYNANMLVMVVRCWFISLSGHFEAKVKGNGQHIYPTYHSKRITITGVCIAVILYGTTKAVLV